MNLRGRSNPTFADAIHLVVGATPAGALRATGAATILCCDDWLAWGPCSADPATQRRLRAELWGRTADGCDFSAERFASALTKVIRGSRPRRPVVVWTADTWSARLGMLWLFAALAAAGDLGGSLVYLADVRTRHEPRPRGYGTSIELGHNPSDRLREAFGTATRPVSWPTIRAGANLWRRYAGPDPTAFDAARRRGFSRLPMLRSVSNAYGVLFPRFVRGTLRPSAADAALLRYFAQHDTRDWHLMGRVVVWVHHQHRYLIDALGSERWVWERLDAWSEGDEPILDSRPDPRPDSRQRLYRLTAVGLDACRDSRVAHGLMPPAWVGGCRLYNVGKPWARVSTGRGWKVVDCATSGHRPRASNHRN